MQWATAFYANHSLDGAIDAGWSENAKYIFAEKCIIFKFWLLRLDLAISVTNGFQANIKRLKMCSLKTFHVSGLLK